MKQSLPVVPAQPAKPQYGIGELALFEQYMTVEAYTAKFGEAPPPFNPNLRPKYWFDSSVDATDLEADVEYLIPRLKDGVWKLIRTTLPVWEAISVNIPETMEGAATPSHPQFAGRGRPMREVPVRPLLPGESLFAGFGNLCMVARADLLTKQDEESGKFLPSDRELMRKIADKLGVPK
jgi:hypothetical protein